jgi:hypothetical protein
MHTRHGRALETPWAWGLSFLGAAIAALLGAVVGGSGHHVAAVVAFAVLAAASAAAAPLAAAPLMAGTCWCFYDGFFVHRHGQLAVHPTDLYPLALLAAAALLGWAVGHIVRRRSSRRVPTEEANPLRRPTDVARDRLRRRRARLLLLAAVVGAGTGTVAFAQEGAAAAAARVSGHQVTATTEVAATPPVERVPRGGGAPLLIWVPVRWQYPAGVDHESTVTVLRGSPPGTKVMVWVDRSGNPAPAPAGAADLLVLSALVALAVAAGGAGLVAGGTGLVLRALDRRDWRAWELDWARVEPDWSGRRRHHGI